MGLSGCPQNVLFGRCSRDPCVYLEAADHLGASGCTFRQYACNLSRYWLRLCISLISFLSLFDHKGPLPCRRPNISLQTAIIVCLLCRTLFVNVCQCAIKRQILIPDEPFDLVYLRLPVKQNDGNDRKWTAQGNRNFAGNSRKLNLKK